MLKKYEQKIAVVINLKIDNSILVKEFLVVFRVQYVKSHLMNFLIRHAILLSVRMIIAKKEI